MGIDKTAAIRALMRSDKRNSRTKSAYKILAKKIDNFLSDIRGGYDVDDAIDAINDIADFATSMARKDISGWYRLKWIGFWEDISNLFDRVGYMIEDEEDWRSIVEFVIDNLNSDVGQSAKSLVYAMDGFGAVRSSLRKLNDLVDIVPSGDNAVDEFAKRISDLSNRSMRALSGGSVPRAFSRLVSVSRDLYSEIDEPRVRARAFDVAEAIKEFVDSSTSFHNAVALSYLDDPRKVKKAFSSVLNANKTVMDAVESFMSSASRFI